MVTVKQNPVMHLFLWKEINSFSWYAIESNNPTSCNAVFKICIVYWSLSTRFCFTW